MIGLSGALVPEAGLEPATREVLNLKLWPTELLRHKCRWRELNPPRKLAHP